MTFRVARAFLAFRKCNLMQSMARSFFFSRNDLCECMCARARAMSARGTNVAIERDSFAMRMNYSGYFSIIYRLYATDVGVYEFLFFLFFVLRVFFKWMHAVRAHLCVWCVCERCSSVLKVVIFCFLQYSCCNSALVCRGCMR